MLALITSLVVLADRLCIPKCSDFDEDACEKMVPVAVQAFNSQREAKGCRWSNTKGCSTACVEPYTLCVPEQAAGICHHPQSYIPGTPQKNNKLNQDPGVIKFLKRVSRSDKEDVYVPGVDAYPYKRTLSLGKQKAAQKLCPANCKCNTRIETPRKEIYVSFNDGYVAGDKLDVKLDLLAGVFSEDITFSAARAFFEGWTSPVWNISANKPLPPKTLLTALSAVQFTAVPPGEDEEPGERVLIHAFWELGSNPGNGECGGGRNPTITLKPHEEFDFIDAVTTELEAAAILYRAAFVSDDLEGVVYKSSYNARSKPGEFAGCSLQDLGTLAGFVLEELSTDHVVTASSLTKDRLPNLGASARRVEFYIIKTAGDYEIVTPISMDEMSDSEVGQFVWSTLLAAATLSPARASSYNPFGRFADDVPALIWLPPQSTEELKNRITALFSDDKLTYVVPVYSPSAIIADDVRGLYLQFVDDRPGEEWLCVFVSQSPKFEIYQKQVRASTKYTALGDPAEYIRDEPIFEDEKCKTLTNYITDGRITLEEQERLARKLGTKFAKKPGKRTVQPATKMGRQSATTVAISCARGRDGRALRQKYEWLHRIAHSIGGSAADNANNLLFGTSQANTHMITYEGLAKKIINFKPKAKTGSKRKRELTTRRLTIETCLSHVNAQCVFAPARLVYKLQLGTEVVAGIEFDLMMSPRPSLVTNIIAFSDLYTENLETNPDARETIKKRKLLTDKRFSVSLDDDTFRMEMQELLGVAALTWASVGKEEVVGLYDRMHSVYPDEVSAYFENPVRKHFPAAHVVRRGNATIVIDAVPVLFTLRTYLIPHPSGNFSHMSELAPSDEATNILGSVPLVFRSTQRLLMMTTELGISPAVLHCGLRLTGHYSYIPGFEAKFVPSSPVLDSITTTGVLRGQYDLRNLNFNGNIHMVARLPIPGGKLTIGTIGDVTLSLVDEIVLSASIASILQMAEQKLRKTVNFQFEASASFAWGPTTDDEVTLRVSGGTVAGSPVVSATLLDWVNPLGLDVTLEEATLTFRFSPFSVDLGAVIAFTNATKLVLDGAYADGEVALRGEAETELSVEEVLEWFSNYSGTAAQQLPDNAPNFTLTEVGGSICTGEDGYTFESGETCEGGLAVWGKAEFNGGGVSVDISISKTAVRFYGHATNLKLAAAVYVGSGSLEFEIAASGDPAPVVEVQTILRVGAAVLFFEGVYMGGDVAVIAGSASPLNLSELAGVQAAITLGTPVEIPSDVPAFTLNEFVLSICTTGHTFVVYDTTCREGMELRGSATFFKTEVEVAIGISATRLALKGAASNFAITDAVVVDTVFLDFELLAAEGPVPATFSMAVGAAINVTSALSFAFEGTYASDEGWAVYGGMAGVLDTAGVAELFRKVTGGAELPATYAPDLIFTGGVFASYCTNDHTFGTVYRPSGFMVSGDGTLAGTAVSLELVISKTGIRFAGDVRDLTIGSFTIHSAALAFEYRTNDTEPVSVTATATTVITDLATFAVTWNLGAETTFEASDMNNGAGIGNLLEFLELLTDEELISLSDPDKLDFVQITRLKIVYSPPGAETPYPDGFSFEVAMKLFGVSFDTEIFSREGVAFDFCFGPCVGNQPINPNDTRAIYGDATIKGDSSVGIEMAVRANLLTIGNVAYMAASALELEDANATYRELGDLATLGIADATLTVRVSDKGFELGVSGSPSLPSATDDDFLSVVTDEETMEVEQIVFAIKATASFAGALSLTLSVRSGPIGAGADSNFQIVDPTDATLGFAVFLEVFFDPLAPPPGGRLGVSLPLKICVERCNPEAGSGESKRFIYLVGDLELKVTPVAQIVKGRLTLDGVWEEPFGITFLHFSDVVLGIGWDLKAPVPSAVTIGGTVCLGNKENCSPASAGPSITGRVYLGVSATELDNYFIVMVTEVTFGNLKAILSEHFPELAEVDLGEGLEGSGIKPFDLSNCEPENNVADPLDACKCGEDRPCTLPVSDECSQAVAERCPDGKCPEEEEPVPFDKDCFAYFSFALAEKTFKFRSGDVVIPAGVGFSGRLDFNGWNIALEVAVSLTRFYVNGSMDHADIKLPTPDGPVTFVRLGKTLVRSDAGAGYIATGDAEFLVDVKLDELPVVLIHGAFDIPLLQSYGELAVTWDKGNFSFEAEIYLFAGALQSRALVAWDSGFSFFKMELADLDFAAGLVSMKNLVFEYEQTLAYARFSADVSVLYGAFALSTWVSVRDGEITFAFSVTAAEVTTEVAGEAAIAIPFENSEFSVSATIDFGPIGEGFNEAIEHVTEFADNVWTAVENGAKTIMNAIAGIFAPGGSLEALERQVDDLEASDVRKWLVGYSEKVSDNKLIRNMMELGLAFTTGSSEAIEETLFALGETVGLVGREGHTDVTVRNGDGVVKRNEYGCPYKKTEYEECVYFFRFCDFNGNCLNEGIKICTPKETSPFVERACMEKVAAAAAKVEELTAKMKDMIAIVTNSKEKNPGLVKVIGGLAIPAPVMQKTSIVTRGDAVVETDVTGSVHVLNGPMGPDGSTVPVDTSQPFRGGKKDVTTTAAVSFESKEAYYGSLRSTKVKLGKSLAHEALAAQEGLLTDAKLRTLAPWLFAEYENESFVPTAKPVLGPVPQPPVFACHEKVDLGAYNPTMTVDPKCVGKTTVRIVGQRALTQAEAEEAYPNRVCGTNYLRVQWLGTDGCGVDTDVATQIVQFAPVDPSFETFPPDKQVTTKESIDPEFLGSPTSKASCGQEVDFTASDSLEAVPNACGSWKLVRWWTIADRNCPKVSPVKRRQTITIVDASPPEWTHTPPAEVVVPFFESWRAGVSPTPLTEERAHATMDVWVSRDRQNLLSYPTTLVATDGPLVHTSSLPADEETCRARGLASFTRTWTAADNCGNSRTFRQVVKIQHPPAALTTTQKWDPLQRKFAFSSGVDQEADACNAGKTVTGGKKGFDPIDADGTADNVCGPLADGNQWGEDGCRRAVPDPQVDYTASVGSVKPVFATFPADAVTYTNRTLDARDASSGLGVATGHGYCGTPYTIRYDDASPVLRSCGVWTMERTWKIQPHFADCGGATAVYAARYVTTRVQVITVKDVAAPEWTYKPQADVSIPFFSNYRVENSMPLTDEVAHPDMLRLGLVSYPTRTTSSDGAVLITNASSADEAVCRVEGVARLNRTWTTMDACGNSRSFVQLLTIEHPPAELASTQPWNASSRMFSFAPGVEQLPDACHAGKTVIVGDKEFAAIDSSRTVDNACSDPVAWDAVACRLFGDDAGTADAVAVHSVRPYFQHFPPDVATFTNNTLDAYSAASGLGIPVGAAFCGTPFTMRYDDAPAVLQSCGVWTIERTWKIQPHYADCGNDTATYAEALTTRRVQVITVNDVFPPQFIATPAADQWVEFWSDYGSAVHGVPLIEDIATHPDMARLGLVSYNITLEHEDVHVAFESSNASCETGLAVVTRVWTATDRCLTAGSWTQTIRVKNPTAGGRDGNMEELNGYQVFSSGKVDAYKVKPFEGNVGSEEKVWLQWTKPAGDVTMYMKHTHKNGEDDDGDDDGHTDKFGKSKKHGTWHKHPHKVTHGYSDIIADFSDKLFSPLDNWHTGPKHVTCSTANQSSCIVDVLTPPGPAATHRYSKKSNTMYLEGGDLVYSVFMGVDVNKWMYDPHWREAEKPEMVVRAGGFVIVNMEYEGWRLFNWKGMEKSKNNLRDAVFEQPEPAGANFTVYNLRRADKSVNTEYLDIVDSTVRGTIISQDRHCAISIKDSLVHGQVIASSKKMTLWKGSIFGDIFAANVVCMAP
ncbi:hypothetical protein DIPPA_34312 [Diplonema papillatum]|nr:hypothetical protein DIPPA_34312 [Diplonema papillatum]